MVDRESILPLTLGAVVAALVHLVLVPLYAQSWGDRAAIPPRAQASADVKHEEKKREPEQKKEEEKKESEKQEEPRAKEEPAPVAPPRVEGPVDLIVPLVNAPARVVNGSSVIVDFAAFNRGEGGTASAAWNDRVYLSADPNLDGKDVALAQLPHQGTLAPGQEYRAVASVRIQVPEKMEGRMFLIVHVDADNAVAETDDGNNFRAVPIEIEQVAIGKDRPRDEVAVAWIAYDDFKKLVAVESTTQQPAIQNKVDPVANAPLPRDPTPAAPPARKPVEAAQATPTQPAPQPTTTPRQPVPVESPALPAKLVEAESPVTTPSPKPVSQPKAEAIVTAPAPPKPQPIAQGPSPVGSPVKQAPAFTPRSTPAGQPATQAAAKLPEPIAPASDPAALAALPTRLDDASRDPAKATVAAISPKPTTQLPGDTPLPKPSPLPIQQPEVKAPPAATGQPTRSDPAKTPNPAPDGKLGSAKAVDGPNEPATKPAPTSTQPGEAAPKSQDTKTQQPTPPSPPSNPTAAPKEESNIPPTILDDVQLPISPGGVITRQGIQIVAATPDISITSWLVSGPTAVNPVARITFDRSGRVENVELLRSTGHANLDSPVKAAFYSFKAKGKALQRVRNTFSMEIRLLLKSERGAEPDGD